MVVERVIQQQIVKRRIDFVQKIAACVCLKSGRAGITVNDSVKALTGKPFQRGQRFSVCGKDIDIAAQLPQLLGDPVAELGIGTVARAL